MIFRNWKFEIRNLEFYKYTQNKTPFGVFFYEIIRGIKKLFCRPNL